MVTRDTSRFAGDVDEPRPTDKASATSGASASAGPSGSAGPSASESTTGGPKAARRLGQEIEELRAYASYYLAAKTDGIKLSVKRVAIWAAIGVVGLLVLAAYICTATVLLILGAAQGLAELWVDHPWIASLVTGGALLLVLAVALYAMLGIISHSSRKRTLDKYARRRQQQRAEFGHDVEDRARVAP